MRPDKAKTSARMDTYRHLVITTFNVPITDDIDAYPRRLDPRWLADRFTLFEKYCLPSVRSQSSQDFTWVVYFDSRTPAVFRERIRGYGEYRNFVPVFADDQYIITERYLGDLTRNCRFLITTKLDNDDAMARDYVGAIQAQFDQQPFTFLNFTRGLVLCDGRLYCSENFSNPYISLIESINGFRTIEPRDDPDMRLITSEPAWVNGFKTAYCLNHARLDDLGLATQVSTGPMWLQVVHGRNTLETGPGREATRQPLRRLRGRFDVEMDLTENPAVALADQAWSAASVWAKKRARRIRDSLVRRRHRNAEHVCRRD